MSLADQQWCPTSVQVTVLQARGLRIKGKSGTNDAYAVIQVGKDKYQTSVVEKCVAPVWKEEASFDLPQLQQGGGGGGSALHVHVLHRALVGPDKLLGQAVINLLQLSEDKTRNKTEWFKLLDKTGKPDKDRGEVLVDIQFMRNNMTASMFDLSAAGKSRSRLSKFKDKVRGKKKDSDPVTSVVPTFTQVLTDSEEEANGDGEAAAGKDAKHKKHKIKSLFSPKSNLQKSMSQSMTVLPGKNSTLSGSQSSGLNVESSEGKKKFKFMIHKRSGSSDSKDSSSGHEKQAPVEQSNLCINGSHIYCEEPPPRTSRISSNFSLTSSGHGSMEDVPENSPSSDPQKAVGQYSPWEEEEEEEEEEMSEVENLKESVNESKRTIMEEERKEEKVRRQQKKLESLAEDSERQEEEETRAEEEEVKREQEKIRREEEKKRQEQKERLRMEEERERLAEEKRLQELERRKLEERRQRDEEERIRIEEEKRLEEERVKMEERRREEQKLAEEKRRLEEERRAQEEKRRQEKEAKLAEEKRLQELERRKLEEERKKQRDEEERIRIEEEEKRLEEERRRQEEQKLAEEKRRLEEERRAQEEKRRQETEAKLAEEKRLQERRLEEERKKQRDEEERIRIEEEEKRLEEERVKMEERRRREEQKLAEEKRLQELERRKLEEERIRIEEEEKRLEERRQAEQKLAEEKRRLEEETRAQEEKKRQDEEAQMEEKRLQKLERRKLEEERIRIEERKRLEEEKVKMEKTRREEQKLAEEKRRLEEERVRKEKENRRKEEERRQKEEEELRKQEHENKRIQLEQERRQREEKERIRKEEEKKRQEEQARKEKEEYKRLVEEKMQQEEQRIKEEKIKMEEEERVRMEEELVRRKEEKERAQKEKEEMERLEEERLLKEKEKRRIEEEQKVRREEEERIRREKKEVEAKTLEKLRNTEEQERKENKTKDEGRAAGKNPKVSSPAEIASTNPFDENFSCNPFEEIPEVQQRCQSAVSSVGSKTVSLDEKDLISTQREKRPAPQPPGRSQAEKQTLREQDVSARHLAQMNKQSKDKDVKTVSVPPQRSVQMITPLSRSPTDSKNSQSLMPSHNANGTTDAAKHSKRPAPSIPHPVEEKQSSNLGGAETTEAKAVYGLNPFEDDEDENELTGRDDAMVSSNAASVRWPPAGSQTGDKDPASQPKIKSLKMAHAPPPPAVDDITSSTLINPATEESRAAGDRSADAPDSSALQVCDPHSDATSPVHVQESLLQESQTLKLQNVLEAGVKKDGPQIPSRRLQPVRPLNPLEQQGASVVQGENKNKSTGILSGVQDKTKVPDSGIKGPYSQLTREELISLVLKQENQLLERDSKISELEQYIDNLLVRVIEEKPSILMSMCTMKKAA